MSPALIFGDPGSFSNSGDLFLLRKMTCSRIRPGMNYKKNREEALFFFPATLLVSVSIEDLHGLLAHRAVL